MAVSGLMGLLVPSRDKGEMLRLYVKPSAKELALASGGCVGVASVYLLISASQGALGVSRNDDWAYLRILFRLAQDGVFDVDVSPHAFFAGQAFLFLPIVQFLGPSITALQIGVALLGALGLWCCYVLIRMFLSVGASILSLGCLALGPFFGTLSVSFMTDVPAFGLQAAALLLGTFALSSRQTNLGLLSAALVVAAIAFATREFAIASGITILIAAWVRKSQWRTGALVSLSFLTVAWVVCIVLAYRWRRGLLNSVDVQLEFPPTNLLASLDMLAGLFLTLALLTIPVLMLASPLRLVQQAWKRKRVQLVGVALLMPILIWWRPPLVPGYFAVQTSYDSTVLGIAPEYFPVLAWKVLWFAALGAAGSLALLGLSAMGDIRHAAVRSSLTRSLQGYGTTGLILPFAGLCLALSAASILFTNAPYFDRYLMPVLPFVSSLVVLAAVRLRLRTPASDVLAWASLFVLGVYSLGLMHAVAALDGAKWRLSNHLVTLGFSPSEIAGGMEWWGLHFAGPVVPEADRPEITPWWLGIFGERRACALVMYAESSGDFGEYLGMERVDTLMGGSIILAAKEVPGCDLRVASTMAGY